MTFLSEYDSLRQDDLSGRAAVVVKWLRSDWRGMFSDLRANRPVLATPLFTMVTRATDVIDVLSRPTLFSVRANAVTMDPSVGPFMLARDDTSINWHEKSVMRAVLQWEDLPAIRAHAGETARVALDEAGGEIDVVQKIARLVPLRIVQRYFGFAAPDADVLRWSFATQHAMFRNLTGDPQVVERCVRAGEEMRAWLWPFLATKWAAPRSSAHDVVSRIVRLSRSPDIAMAPARVVSNVCGLLVGAIETMSQAIVQALDQILARPAILEQAHAAACAGDTREFDGIVFEALRFNPITAIQFRTAEARCEIGTGTPYAATIAAGSRVAACTGSAMFDAGLMPDPDNFNPKRPSSAYLHFGLGHHECLGKYVGLVAIPEAVRQIVLKSGLRRKEGALGQIDFAQGPFPEHFHVAWDFNADNPQACG
jgi:cytochrome P450